MFHESRHEYVQSNFEYCSNRFLMFILRLTNFVYLLRLVLIENFFPTILVVIKLHRRCLIFLKKSIKSFPSGWSLKPIPSELIFWRKFTVFAASATN